jgi:NADPH:quinone reductase-like Zn-dependent oxidoreductase
MAQTTTKTMKAVAISRFGGLEELKECDLPRPEVAPDEVLIRVRAAGVGVWDTKQRTGDFGPKSPAFPLILGSECAGDIERVGSKVTTLHDGDPVYAYFLSEPGAYAQYVAVKANLVARKPASLSYLEAGVVPVIGTTAHQAVFQDLKVQPEEWLFIAGGAGGVGSMAVQIAIAIGARVIASAAGSDFEYLESLGVPAANLIDYQRADVPAAVRAITNGVGADVALDAVGGASAKQTIHAVRDGGRLGDVGFQDIPAERGISVVHVSSVASSSRLDALRGMFDAGQIKVHVIASFPLSQARDAQEAIGKPHPPGEFVISVNDVPFTSSVLASAPSQLRTVIGDAS